VDHHHPRPAGELATTAEVLRRSRPALTNEEIDRLDRRVRPRPRAPRRRSSTLAVACCAALGLLFTTAGTGLAISGFATEGSAVQAQYPDQGSTAPQPRGGGVPGALPTRPPTTPSRRPGARTSTPPTLGDSAAGRQGPPSRTALARAETRSAPPFTGFGAIPILIAGIALFVTSAVVHRRPAGER
jgi:hypothetical protein